MVKTFKFDEIQSDNVFICGSISHPIRRFCNVDLDSS